jgi:hypothetical protein
VHEYVDATPLRLRFGHYPVDVVGRGDVRSNGKRLAAGSVRSGHHLFRFGGTGPVIDGDAKSALRQKERSCRTDAPTGTGDYRNT